MADPNKPDETKAASKPAETAKANDTAKTEETKRKKDEGSAPPAPEPSQDELDAIRSRALTGAAGGGYKTR